MGGAIVRPKVGLGLHDPADPLDAARGVDQVFSQQFPGDRDRVSILECAGQFLHGRQP